MTQALTVAGQRHPAQASGRLRKAAEHYVKNGCRALGPSLVWAGYAATTAKDPGKNGYTHDRLVEVARYFNKGAQATARSHLAAAINTLNELLDPSQPGTVRGSAAKTLADMAGKEAESQDDTEVAAEEQAKWMMLVRHWKRVFLRRGILLGMGAADARCNYKRPGHSHCQCPSCECVVRDPEPCRADRLLAELNWALGKGPEPLWTKEEDGEGVLGLEGDSRPGPYLEAEIMEGPEWDGGEPPSEPTGSGPSPTDPE